MPTFYDRFRENAECRPDNIAVEIQRRDHVESFTYAELQRMADSIGRWLTEQEMKRGVLVAILAANHPRWFAAYLGVLAAGAVVVPLDTNLGVQQLARLLEDSRCSLLFCDWARFDLAQEAAASSSIRIVILDEKRPVQDTSSAWDDSQTCLDSILDAGPGAFTAASVPDDELAVLLYTSGTTDDPKGVMLRHSNLTGEVDAGLSWAPIGPGDTVLGVLPLFHVLAQITNFVVPLAVGARVVFLETLNSTELLRALSERNVTALTAVPQLFYLIHDRIFKEVAARGRLTHLAVRSAMALNRLARTVGWNPGNVLFRRIHRVFGERMRYLLSAGSRFDTRVARDFHALGIDILQAYGLTETTAAAFATPPGGLVIDSVGIPLAGVEAKIADPQLEEDARRTVGEIVIRGKTVMKGYWNRPDSTAAVLRDGWLSTGDLGYFDDRGNLFITGRKKEVIILGNGKNIYPEELETHYLKSPFIKEICVLGLEVRPGDAASERLHAVVVPNFDELKRREIIHAKEALRFDIEGLSSQLPSAKRIVGYDIWQEDLPRTTTRKIKRYEVERRVRANRATQASAAEDRPPTLTHEDSVWLQEPDVRRAMAVIADACKTKPVSIAPDFNLELDLGLDSMQRVELITVLEQALNSRADESRLAKVYSVRQLVDVVREGAKADSSQSFRASSMPWQRILREDPAGPAALALAHPARQEQRLWYVVSQLVKLIALGPYRLRVKGVDKVPSRGPFLICPNHQSFMDSLIMSSVLPWPVFRELFYVGASDVFRARSMRVIAQWRQIIAVDPDTNLIPAMRAGAFGLRHGRVLVLYPEGERSIDGLLKQFKKGGAILSIHTQAPIVPVALEGFHDAWPRGKAFPRLARLQIKFGDPVYPPPESEASGAAYEELIARVRAQVVSMWEELRGNRAV